MTKKEFTFDNFLELQCAKQMSAYEQNMAHTEVKEIVEYGEVIFSYEQQLHDNVVAAIKELRLKAYERFRPWHVVVGGHEVMSGKDVLICQQGAYWCNHTLNFNEQFHPIK